MKKEIVIEIDERGNVKAEAFGYAGTACDLDVDTFMAKLGKDPKPTRKQGEAVAARTVKVSAGTKR